MRNYVCIKFSHCLENVRFRVGYVILAKPTLMKVSIFCKFQILSYKKSNRCTQKELSISHLLLFYQTCSLEAF